MYSTCSFIESPSSSLSFYNTIQYTVSSPSCLDLLMSGCLNDFGSCVSLCPVSLSCHCSPPIFLYSLSGRLHRDDFRGREAPINFLHYLVSFLSYNNMVHVRMVTLLSIIFDRKIDTYHDIVHRVFMVQNLKRYCSEPVKIVLLVVAVGTNGVDPKSSCKFKKSHEVRQNTHYKLICTVVIVVYYCTIQYIVYRIQYCM
jgi:hypothetical protein